MTWFLLFVFVMPYAWDFQLQPVAYTSHAACDAAYDVATRDVWVAWVSPCREISEKDFARLSANPYTPPPGVGI